MASILQLLDFFVHLDHHLDLFVSATGGWSYLLLWLITFADTGLIITPFFPTDSLIFVSGSLAALGSLQPGWLALTFFTAAVTGDSINYTAGQFLSRQVAAGRAPFIKQAHLDRTFAFFEKHGPKTIVLSRFVPIVRTFAPFVSGLGAMPYRRFVLYNALGATLWVGLVLPAGYSFGRLPLIQENFSLILPGVALFSQLPLLGRWLFSRLQNRIEDRTPA